MSLLQWFWRVLIWLLSHVDIPRLSSDGIHFGDCCFSSISSYQFSSTYSRSLSSFDASGLKQYITFGDKTPSSTTVIVKNRAEQDSIPSTVEDLWIGRFDTTEVTDMSFNAFQSLRSLVFGNSVLWKGTKLELYNLRSLQSIDIDEYCFYYASSFSLISFTDCIVWIHRSSSTTISQNWWMCIQSCAFGCVWEW